MGGTVKRNLTVKWKFIFHIISADMFHLSYHLLWQPRERNLRRRWILLVKLWHMFVFISFSTEFSNFWYVHLGSVCFTENHFRENIFRKMTYEKIFYGKKKRKKKLVKCFTFFKSVRHFTKKWLDFQLTRKMFSVDHLFSAKQTPENAENIFL